MLANGNSFVRIVCLVVYDVWFPFNGIFLHQYCSHYFIHIWCLIYLSLPCTQSQQCHHISYVKQYNVLTMMFWPSAIWLSLKFLPSCCCMTKPKFINPISSCEWAHVKYLSDKDIVVHLPLCGIHRTIKFDIIGAVFQLYLLPMEFTFF